MFTLSLKIMPPSTAGMGEGANGLVPAYLVVFFKMTDKHIITPLMVYFLRYTISRSAVYTHVTKYHISCSDVSTHHEKKQKKNKSAE